MFVLISSAACVFLTAFATNAYSLFLPELAKDFGWSYSAAILPLSLAMIVWGITQPFAGAIADARGTRPLILAGTLVMAAGFSVMAAADNLWLLAIGYGLLVGAATSACGFVLFSLLISKWFNRVNRASGVGLVQAATPAGPVLIAPAMFWAIDQFGWRFAAVGFALLLVLIIFPLAWLGVHDPKTGRARAVMAPRQGRWQDAVEVARTPALRNLFIARIACGLSAMMIAHLAASALDFGLSPADGAIALGVFGATAALGSFLGGLAADRWGRIPTLVATYFVRGIGTLAIAILTLNNFQFFLAVALATGPIFATVGVNNVQVFEIVGARRAGFVLGLSMVLHQLAAATGTYWGGLLFDWTGTYRVSFFALAVVLLLATIPAAGARYQPERAGAMAV